MQHTLDKNHPPAYNKTMNTPTDTTIEKVLTRLLIPHLPPPYTRVNNNNLAITDNQNFFIKISKNYEALQTELETTRLLDFTIKPLHNQLIAIEDYYLIIMPYVKSTTLVPNELTQTHVETLTKQIHQIHQLNTESYSHQRNIAVIHQMTKNRLAHPSLSKKQIKSLVRISKAFIHPYIERYMNTTTLTHTDVKTDNILIINDHAKLIDYESIKQSPTEIDLASLYQDLYQTGHQIIYNKFATTLSQHENIDQQKLEESILFKNSFTTLIAARLKDHSVLNQRIDILEESINTRKIPTIMPKVNLDQDQYQI
jgi:thiamine kinase-like enzyme